MVFRCYSLFTYSIFYKKVSFWSSPIIYHRTLHILDTLKRLYPSHRHPGWIPNSILNFDLYQLPQLHQPSHIILESFPATHHYISNPTIVRSKILQIHQNRSSFASDNPNNIPVRNPNSNQASPEICWPSKLSPSYIPSISHFPVIIIRSQIPKAGPDK